MTTGQKIQAMRLSAGITQTELSERIATVPNAISRYEHDVIDPTSRTIRKLCNALECEPNDIVGDDEL